jgi:hypothetical protein
MLVVGGLMALAAAGCGGNKSGPGLIPEERTVLRVDNQSFNDMRIYVIQGGQRIRVGTANGKQESKFTLPKSVVSGYTTIRVQAVPIGANGSSVSEEITITPGDDLSLRITP